MTSGDFDAVRIPVMMSILLFVSLGLAVAGLAIDLNYVWRKFRAIRDLNALLAIAPGLDPADDAGNLERVRPYLRVSGDSGDRSYVEVGGYARAAAPSGYVYLLPIALIFAGIGVYGICVSQNL